MGRKRSQIKRVHIEGEEWQYQVGTSTISIRDPQGKRVSILRSKVVRGQAHNYQRNYDPDYAGPYREADTFTYPTPSIVKNYIWRKLRPGNLILVPGDYEQAKDCVLRFFCGDQKQEPERIAGAQK